MRALTFTAFLRPGGAFEVDPGFVVEIDALPEQPPGDGEAVEVRALSEAGVVLAATRVPLVDPCAPPMAGVTSPSRTAVGLVGFPERAAALEAVADEVVIWELRRPDRPLEVDVEWPDAVDRGPVRVAWRSSAEGCQAVLGWTADGGKTTAPLSLPTTAREIVVDLRYSPGGPKCAFVLQVTDGWSTVVRRSTVQLPKGGWQVWILAPAEGEEVPADEPVLLAGQAFHLEEHRPSEDLIWSSSLSGGLGSGSRVLAALEPGEHVITARLGEASASVTIRAGQETSGTPAPQ
ncbi:hypothetical protein AB0392_24965 [Nonomuraea angiospora]|uniref:hypothetical protein n=1 Tax=Nonomuraea angiospora TaxID=46172 RepID=UPI00344FBE80